MFLPSIPFKYPWLFYWIKRKMQRSILSVIPFLKWLLSSFNILSRSTLYYNDSSIPSSFYKEETCMSTRCNWIIWVKYTSPVQEHPYLLSPEKEVKLPNKKNGAKDTSQSSVIIKHHLLRSSVFLLPPFQNVSLF